MRPHVIVLACVLLAACRSKSDEPSAPEIKKAPPSAASAPAFSARLTRPAPDRLVAIGDLHGDLDATRRALRLAGAIDAKDAWSGGALVVVQTGDAIDRGDDDRAILDLLERLKKEAKAAGGELIALAGNHELMNASLDFRYVTPGAFTTFADVHPTDVTIVRLPHVEPNAKGRAAAFIPGGPYATLVAERPIFVKVGDSVFVHGGILPKHVRYGLDRMNDEVRDWLLGKQKDPPAVVVGEDGPVWSRMYSAAPGREECATLGEALSAMGAKRMVVGHTVQRNGVSPACDGRVWRIDTGLSKFYGGKLEVLEIRGDAVTVRRPEVDGG
ncbi:MAG: metallophosphoesterase [Labilithrix sp.]|nr:metallophosphoesterase [Labilithrix sp.]